MFSSALKSVIEGVLYPWKMRSLAEDYFQGCKLAFGVNNPPDCYFHMLWKRQNNLETLKRNKGTLKELGLYDYHEVSLKLDSNVLDEIELVILVIVRWHDLKSRMFLRNTVKNKKNTKLLFVFGIPKSAKKEELQELQQENNEYQDLIIPSELYS